jgi:hypothetical protein
MLRSTRSNSSSRMLRKQNNQCLSSGPATTAAPWQENKEVLRSLHGSRKRKRKASARGGGGAAAAAAAAADEEKKQTKRQRLRVGGSTARRQRQARELRVSNEVPNKGDLETQVPGILWPSDSANGTWRTNCSADSGIRAILLYSAWVPNSRAHKHFEATCETSYGTNPKTKKATYLVGT